MGGVVVRAVKGHRADYQPIRTSLCNASNALDVVAALRTLGSFDTFYIADLDAILRRGTNCTTLHALKNAFPDICWWIDAGIGDIAALHQWLAGRAGRPVIGSETLADLDALDGAPIGCEPILSLDYRGDILIGPAELMENLHRWPRQVIAMTLSRVGSGAGPDIHRLRQLRELAPSHDIFAAGGIRSAADLADVERVGVAGVLLASALHDGTLQRTDLARYG